MDTQRDKAKRGRQKPPHGGAGGVHHEQTSINPLRNHKKDPLELS